jgi:tetratricopeptide (TPR) repeat protein
MANNIVGNNFVDVEVRIFKRQDAGYPVEITLGGQQEFPRGYMSADILPWISSSALEADGQRLFEKLFADSALRSAWDEARGQAPQRRIRLRIDEDAAELHTLPWEMLREDHAMLSAQADTTFSRYLPIARPWGGPVEERPIRLLVAISNPDDIEEEHSLPPVDTTLERDTLESALEKVDPGNLQVDFLDELVTPEQLEERLHDGYHILHYTGHGKFSDKLGQAVLYAQDSNGHTQLLFDHELAQLLGRQGVQPRLVFLAACQSATRSTADAFLGMAPLLVSAGVPAVVAMQDFVTVQSTLTFSATFYKRLLEHGQVDLAVNEARSMLLTAKRRDVAVPVLFMRLESGQLWESKAEPETEPGPRDQGITDQHNQVVHGPQTTIGEVQGLVLSGNFQGSVTVGGGDVVDLRGAQDVVYNPDVEYSTLPEMPPLPKPARLSEVIDFVGREKELAYFMEKLETSHLAVITGMAGVGKTDLAVKLAQRFISDPTKIFWHSFRKDEGVDTIVQKLLGFLYQHRQKDLRHKFKGLKSISDLIQEAISQIQRMPGKGYLFYFDDFHYVDSFANEDLQVERFIQQLRTEMPVGKLSLIIVSRRSPSPALVPVGEFEELQGLDANDALRLLKDKLALSDDLLKKLYKRTEGNPLFLRLAINALQRSQKPASKMIAQLGQTPAFKSNLKSKVYERLDENEKDVMKAVSVLMDHHGSSDAIETILGKDEVEVPEVLDSLLEFYLLNKYSNGQYKQHDIIQEFIYAQLGLERYEMHRRAGWYYETKEQDLLKAARHFKHAEDYERSAHLVMTQVLTIANQGHAQELSLWLEKFNDDKLKTTVWAKLNIARGEVYGLLGEEQASEQCYNKIISRLKPLPHMPPNTPAMRQIRARAYLGIGVLWLHRATKKALEQFQLGLRELANGNSIVKAELHIRTGVAYGIDGNYECAIESLEVGLDILNSLPGDNNALQVVALTNLGNIYIEQGNPKQSQEYYDRALVISMKLGDYWKMVDIKMQLAILAEKVGDWNKAEKGYLEVIDFAKQKGGIEHQARLEYNLGDLYLRQGKDRLAEEYLSRSIEICRNHKLNVGLVYCLADLAKLHLRFEELEEAEKVLNEAEKLVSKTGPTFLLPLIYRRWAAFYLKKEQWEKALSCADNSVSKAQELRVGSQELDEEGISQRALGQALLVNGQYEQAIAAFEKSLSILKDCDRYEAARTKAQWGHALLSRGKVTQAERLLKEALATFKNLYAKRDLEAMKLALHINDGGGTL